MKVTICGPNLNDQSRGQFHVHAAGCADLRRGARKEPEYRHGWTIDANSKVKVVEEVYDNIIEENSGDDYWSAAESYLTELHFFPCCAALPVRAETGEGVVVA